MPPEEFLRCDKLTLSVEDGVWTDYEAFVTAGALLRGASDKEERHLHGLQVIALYGGPLADGVYAPWLTTIRSEAQNTFQEAVLAVADFQSLEQARETIRKAALADLDAQGAAASFLDWMAKREMWGQLDDILHHLDGSSSIQSSRSADGLRDFVSDKRSSDTRDAAPSMTTFVCLVAGASRTALARVADAVGGVLSASGGHILTASPIDAETAARQIVTLVPDAGASVHIAAIDAEDELPDYVIDEHASAAPGEVWLSGIVQKLISTIVAKQASTDARIAAA